MERVLVGMSGGVDSSVAAYLLKQQGYEVVGVTVRTWRETEADKASEDAAIRDARRVSEKLGIPHHVVDFSEAFRTHVVCPFIDEYLNGHTPNPCIQCNRHLKWEALLAHADTIGAAFIATGHYANIITLPNGRLSVSSAESAAKDQTYALYRLTQEQLQRTLMPVGAYEKSEIRRIAAEIDSEIAEKHDSQEICFIPDDDYGAFLERQLGERMPGAGNFVDQSGNVLGKHKGYPHYTVGQRKGLELAMGHPVYVTGIRPMENEVVIGENEDLFTKTVFAKNINLMGVSEITGPIEARAKIRYNHKGADCTVSMPDSDTLAVEFREPQRAATPGQSLVIYKDGYILGGGIIQ